MLKTYLFPGHAVGFHHEQSRPDRDDFITILRNNIQQGKSNLFNLLRVVKR